MWPVTLTFLTLAVVAAAGDWVAVGDRRFRLERILKPLTLLLLIIAAGSADLGSSTGWVVAALVFGLLGDVGLLVADDTAETPDLPFRLALASFLIGHLCYLVAFARHGVNGLHLLAGLLIVIGAAALSLPAVLDGARRAGGTALMGIVGSYAAGLAAMAVVAVGTTEVPTAIGGLLFLASDLVIAWVRFVKTIRHGPVLIIVTYHLAQLLIVIGLIRSL
jgi:uncharacterized membrane protein YhhN